MRKHGEAEDGGAMMQVEEERGRVAFACGNAPCAECGMCMVFSCV